MSIVGSIAEAASVLKEIGLLEEIELLLVELEAIAPRTLWT